MLRYNYTERQASAAAVASPLNPLCTWWRFPWRLETGLGPIFKHQPGHVLTAAAAAAAGVVIALNCQTKEPHSICIGFLHIVDIALITAFYF